MKIEKIIFSILTLLIGLTLFSSCGNRERRTKYRISNYEHFKDSVLSKSNNIEPDTTNIFDDDTTFIPGVDSIENLLYALDTLLNREARMMIQKDSFYNYLKKGESNAQAEKLMLLQNISILDSFFKNRKSEEKITCKEKECYLYVEVIKSRQVLYLYLDGELTDSFKVSTGKGRYRTPDCNLQPSGPIFTQYTSKKFPGGNYQGFGNMPYAVFVKGGYAIHGTTPGNFSKLGTPASHGCIRVHPDNGRVFYELVKLVGLSNTWVNVRDSL